MNHIVLTPSVVALVVSVAARVAYVQWHHSESMENVITVIQGAERDHGLAFDLLDAGLWEQIPDGHRLHGMFVTDL